MEEDINWKQIELFWASYENSPHKYQGIEICFCFCLNQSFKLLIKRHQIKITADLI